LRVCAGEGQFTGPSPPPRAAAKQQLKFNYDRRFMISAAA
jgi:hypothetical protein